MFQTIPTATKAANTRILILQRVLSQDWTSKLRRTYKPTSNPAAAPAIDLEADTGLTNSKNKPSLVQEYVREKYGSHPEYIKYNEKPAQGEEGSRGHLNL
ncbi:hypothetical protein J6590_030874 [Homalodisca vitripennis]|nr:hypothetical protein J6590_030874 [Homalodisca vitripennis]